MADVENPAAAAAAGHGGAEEFSRTAGLVVCAGACCACTTLAVSGILIYLWWLSADSAHVPFAVRLLGGAGFIATTGVFSLGALCGFITLHLCIDARKRKAQVAPM